MVFAAIKQQAAHYTIETFAAWLGLRRTYLLNHTSTTISKADLHLPGPDFVDRVWFNSDRNPRVLRSLQAMFEHGRWTPAT